MNIGKTKEMLCDYRKKSTPPPLVEIDGREVERVEEYKYLGTMITSDLSWTTHIDSTIKKCHSRLYFLRKLRQFGVSQTILTMFYMARIESILTYNFITWYSAAGAENKDRIQKITHRAEKVTGCDLPHIDSLFPTRIKKKVGRITKDPSHPLHGHFQLLPSNRRYRSVKSRTSRFSNTFIPSAIRVLNSSKLEM